MPELSIIIVSWNTRELLASCLSSLERHGDGVAFETIVVDNNSSDGSPEMVRERFTRVRLIANSENVGFARANNQAIRSSTSEYVLLLNSDAEVLPGALGSLMECLRKRPKVGVAGGVLLNSDGSFQASYAAFPTLTSEFFLLTGLARWVYGPYFPSAGPEASREERAADWVGGACMMVRRAAIDAVGMMNERYFLYSEEMEWCYAMRRGGWQVLCCPQARVIHHGGQSSNQVSQYKLARLYRSKLQFFRANYGLLTAVVLRLLIALTSGAKAAVLMLGSLFRTASRAQHERLARAHWNALWLMD